MRISVRLKASDDWFMFLSCKELILLFGTPLPVLMVEILPAPFYSKNWLISSRFCRLKSNKFPLPWLGPFAAARPARDDIMTGACGGTREEPGLGGSPSVCSGFDPIICIWFLCEVSLPSFKLTGTSVFSIVECSRAEFCPLICSGPAFKASSGTRFLAEADAFGVILRGMGARFF